MKEKYIICLFLLSLLTTSLKSQNTVGTTLNTAESYNGYSLITPSTETTPSTTYLINNCGEVVNSWQSDFPGQGLDYLLEDGSLYRGCTEDLSTLIYAGKSGRIERYDWEGNLIWAYTFSDTDFTYHHDFYPMNNGNLLVLIAERRTQAEAIQNGRDPNQIPENELYTERIIEVEPIGSDEINIVWEWDLWDHLIQDFDSTKDNFGVVSENPQLLNINFVGLSNGAADWTHVNSMDYNEDLDQIVLGSRSLSEFYIIDHSTTTAQAAGSTGGNSNMGGDFLYRWGNPQAYDLGTTNDQDLFGQHAVHWVPDDLPDAGNIMIFNNGVGRNFTTVDQITPPLLPDGTYDRIENEPYGPENANIIYQDPVDPTNFFVPFLSSAYQLPNGNYLLDRGPVGQVIEVTPGSEIVWEYISPVLLNGTILSQGDAPGGINSRFYRAKRYGPEYEAFDGRDLIPGDPIESNPDPSGCTLDRLDVEQEASFTVFPNPVIDNLQIRTTAQDFEIQLIDLKGSVIGFWNNPTSLSLQTLKSGLYFVHFRTPQYSEVKKIVIR